MHLIMKRYMKKMYVLLLGVVIFNFSVVINAEAAAISRVETYADWDNLTITIGTEGTDYTSWYDKSSNASADASTNLIPQSQVGPNSINSWGSVSATRDITDAKGHAYTTSTLVAAKTSSKSDGITNTMAWATGTANRRGYFDMITSSDLTFQVPFWYSHEISTSLPGEYASATSWARFDLLGDNDGDSIFDDILAWGIFGDITNTAQDGSGQFQHGPTTISLSYSGFEAGETYAFNLRIYSHSYAEGLPGANVVPEPSSLLLLGFGIFGIGFFKKRRNI